MGYVSFLLLELLFCLAFSLGNLRAPKGAGQDSCPRLFVGSGAAIWGLTQEEHLSSDLGKWETEGCVVRAEGRLEPTVVGLSCCLWSVRLAAGLVGSGGLCPWWFNVLIWGGLFGSSPEQDQDHLVTPLGNSIPGKVFHSPSSPCRPSQTVVGTDIAELLLRDHRTLWLPGKSPNEANLIDFTNEVLEQEEESGEAQLSFLTDSQAATTNTLEKETERFRELLLYGRKKVSGPGIHGIHRRVLVSTTGGLGARTWPWQRDRVLLPGASAS